MMNADTLKLIQAILATVLFAVTWLQFFGILK